LGRVELGEQGLVPVVLVVHVRILGRRLALAGHGPIPWLAAEEERPQVVVVELERRRDALAELGRVWSAASSTPRQMLGAPGGA
jgi:hypothetical protein